jgi:hypothetical protein
MITPDFRVSNHACRFDGVQTSRSDSSSQGSSESQSDTSKVQLSLCSKFRCRPGKFALFTGANISEKLPGVNAEFVAIVPAEFDGVFANRFDVVGLGSCLEHRQRRRRQLRRLSRFSASFGAFFIAQSARTSVPQVRKRVAGAVPVFPLNFHACTRSYVDFY